MKNLHILLVEDNEVDILLTTEALEESALTYKVSVVRNGLKAIHFLEQKDEFKSEAKPDLILLDINLPLKNGFEVLTFIKKHKIFRLIPVIIFSTSSSPNDVIDGYLKYANSFVTKPVEGDYNEVINNIEKFWFETNNLPPKDIDHA